LQIPRYLRKYIISKTVQKGKTLVAKDSLFNHLYERSPEDIVRFSDYHPRHSTEAFFYKLLLEKVAFRDEATLLSPHNTENSYFTECQLLRLIDDEQDLEEHVLDYCNRHMFSNDQIGQTMEHLLSTFDPDVHATLNSEDSLASRKAAINGANLADMRLPSAERLIKEFNLSAHELFVDQQVTFDKITALRSGLVLLTGGPGAGKTYLTKLLAKHFRSELDLKVLLAASTGAAAVRLSRSASTNHNTFGIPVRGFMKHLHAAHPMRGVLNAAQVIFIDEMSMMTIDVLQNILMQLMRVRGCTSVADVLKKVLIVLVGDHAQVREMRCIQQALCVCLQRDLQMYMGCAKGPQSIHPTHLPVGGYHMQSAGTHNTCR
jgi:hypothetical protein